MTYEEIIKKIKARGYWEVRLTPMRFNPTLIDERKKLIELIEKAHVRLRGWYYPHISHWSSPTTRKPIVGSNYIEGGVEWDIFIEFWRFYQSGQFVHIFNMHEDYMEGSGLFRGRTDLKEFKPGEVLNTGSVIFEISEILAFVEGLVRQGVYDDGVKIEISLKGTKDRVLKVFDWNKVPLFMDYKSITPSVDWKGEYGKEDVLVNYKKIAIDAISWIFDSFNWINNPRNVFEEDQARLFERRL